MIQRSWRARAAAARADEYPAHLQHTVLPSLRALPGFRGFVLLRRPLGGEIEYVVQTYWESMQAIAAFAGPSLDVAVVEPAAVAALVSYDATVQHHEILVGDLPGNRTASPPADGAGRDAH
jgi:hypothetical protein